VDNSDICAGSLPSEDNSDGASTGASIFASPRSSISSLYTNATAPRLIQGLNRDELFEVVRQETVHEWEVALGPKVVIFIANDTVTNRDIFLRVSLIRRALLKIFPDADPIIGSAEPISACIDWPAVFPFLIHRISESYARRLISQLCWTIDDFTFFAVDFARAATSFVMTLTGLLLPASPDSNRTVETLVRRWLRNTQSVASFIRQHHDNLPGFMIAQDDIEHTLSTVEVTSTRLGFEADSPVAFNVYIFPPTNDPAHHAAWLREVQGITYFADCGTGKATPLFRCSICKARDHSTTSCLFPVNQLLDVGTNINFNYFRMH
jgi:hypothetical protein